jgi:hypothetical protein
MSFEAILGTILLPLTAVGYDALLALLRRWDRAYPSTNPVESTWWFGYVRDLTNFTALIGFGFSFWLLGLRPPLAFLAGLGLGLVAYGLDYVIARRLALRRPGFLLAAVMAPICLVAAALRVPLGNGLEVLLSWLF